MYDVGVDEGNLVFLIPTDRNVICFSKSRILKFKFNKYPLYLQKEVGNPFDQLKIGIRHT